MFHLKFSVTCSCPESRFVQLLDLYTSGSLDNMYQTYQKTVFYNLVQFELFTATDILKVFLPAPGWTRICSRVTKGAHSTLKHYFNNTCRRLEIFWSTSRRWWNDRKRVIHLLENKLFVTSTRTKSFYSTSLQSTRLIHSQKLEYIQIRRAWRKIGRRPKIAKEGF